MYIIMTCLTSDQPPLIPNTHRSCLTSLLYCISPSVLYTRTPSTLDPNCSDPMTANTPSGPCSLIFLGGIVVVVYKRMTSPHASISQRLFLILGTIVSSCTLIHLHLVFRTLNIISVMMPTPQLEQRNFWKLPLMCMTLSSTQTI